MNSKLCKDLGIEFPLFAFSHCRDVVAAVTKAGGMAMVEKTDYNTKTGKMNLSNPPVIGT